MASSVGGLVSGIDTGAIIDSLVGAAGRTKSIMQDQQDRLESRKTAYATLGARLETLQTALDAVSTPADFRSVTGRSASSDDVGVTVDGDAVIGRFSVKVNRLASASMDVSSGISSRDTAGVMATGSLSLTLGGTTTAVTIEADDTLEDVVENINSSVDGVTAYIMETGDAANPYRLVIAGEETGAANAVTIDTSGLDAGTGTVPTFSNVNAAADAEVEVNGTLVYDDDNDIEGAVQGVTFHAYETTSAATTVTVSRDDDGMEAKIQAIADAWNSAMSQIRAQRAWNPDEDIKGAFVGESEPRNVMNKLQSALSAEYGSGALTALAQIGLTSTDDGDLELDTDVLSDALADDFSGVVGFLTGDSGVAQALSSVIDGMIDEDSGTVTGRVDSLDDQIETMTTRIEDYEERLESYRTRLEKQFLAMELAMAKFQSAESALTALLPDTTSE